MIGQLRRHGGQGRHCVAEPVPWVGTGCGTGWRKLECMEILALATQKGIRVYAVKGNWQLDGSMQSKIMALAFAMAAEIEHDLLSQRTKEALRARKSAGITLGRPKGPGKSKLDPYQRDIETLLAHGSTQKDIAHH